MTPILNGNLSIHAIRLKLKKDPFPSKLCSHIPSKMDPSRPLGSLGRTETTQIYFNVLINVQLFMYIFFYHSKNLF